MANICEPVRMTLMLLRKIKTHHKHPKGKVFAWMVLMLGFSVGLLQPIFPNFAKDILGTDTAVSLFYSGMAIFLFLGAMASTILFKKVERATITKWGFAISAIIFFSLIFVTSITELAILQAIKIWLSLILLMALSLFVRDFTKVEELGERKECFINLIILDICWDRFWEDLLGQS